MRWIEVVLFYTLDTSSNKFKRMEYVSRGTIPRIALNQKADRYKESLRKSRKDSGTILSANHIFSLPPALIWFRLPSLPYVSLFSPSAAEPKLVLSGSMRAREYTTRIDRAVIDRFAFRFPRTSHGIARIYAHTTDV